MRFSRRLSVDCDVLRCDARYLEDGGDVFLRDVGNHLQEYTMPESKIPQSKKFNFWTRPPIELTKHNAFSNFGYKTYDHDFLMFRLLYTLLVKNMETW